MGREEVFDSEAGHDGFFEAGEFSGHLGCSFPRAERAAVIQQVEDEVGRKLPHRSSALRPRNAYLGGVVRRRQQYHRESLAAFPRLPQPPHVGFVQVRIRGHEVIRLGLPDRCGEAGGRRPPASCAKAGVDAGNQAVFVHCHHGGY